jgi:hypothetical protein
MDMCIRCNPISELIDSGEHGKVCRFHGTNYILEVRPDPEPAAPAVEPEPEVLL